MLTIGTLSKRTGAKVQTIRYYEQIGLMNEPGRSAEGQRRYKARDLDRLAFIRHCRQLGFSLDVTRDLLGLSDHPARSCAEVDIIARQHLSLVEKRINRLQAQKKELRRMVTECAGNSISECRIIEVLRDHSECLTDHDGTGI